MADAPTEIRNAARRSPGRAAAAAVVGAALAVVTLLHFGLTADGVAWAVVQLLLVFIAWFDVQTRRILNVVVVPAGVVAILLRLAFERGALVECVVAGLVAFAVFLVLALVVRGGLGLGDVKLAALIGLLLGSASLYALLLGVVVGGIAAALLLVARRVTLTSFYAYGPYLALGAAVVALVADVPPLV